MATPATIVELIERFDRNLAAYKSDQYNEARLRIEFLNPFFEALGWDINNRQGYAEAYKDVIYEDAIKIGGATKAPDYCFRIGGTRKFFVEAKKPAVNLKDASDPAFQLRRYAWSAKLPLSILTDFEEFAIYDCRLKPDREDRAATARIVYLPYTDYVQRWDEIASIFSREAILKGSFDTYAEATKGKRGTTEVDAAFLQEIESWREMLARHLALRNKHLTQRELNFAVQMTIDRIIFLRICEDRGIEEYERLKTLLKGTNVYARLCTFFQEADVRYNSGLFHFQKEKDNPEAPDTLTLSLAVDDKPLKDIFKRLYYPESPYEFSALPADVLGKVYEQFLGKVIRLSPSHQVTVEEKPEVRKAGGVYYTPNFIVEYIVQHTLSKLLEGKKPGIRGSASKLKIVDPSCGSGSFLIVAYQYMLDWHRDRYVEDGPEKHHKELYQAAGGQWLLTTQEKKRILLNNIYGVDIDPQAVEVTKLSLLLKVLEGESNQSLVAQLSLFKERALPDLDHNIKCGNSLIDSKFYDKIQQQSLFDEDTQYRINAFDWKRSFPEAFSGEDPGFDVVIGNPPYIRIQALKEWTPLEVEYYKHAYQAAGKGNYDIYVVFVERGLSLLNQHGQLGYILPSKFLTTDYGISLRSLLSELSVVDLMVDFGHSQVFRNATTYTCLLFLSHTQPETVQYLRVSPEHLHETLIQPKLIPSKLLGSTSWLFVDNQGQELLEKLQAVSVPLLELPCEISRGTSTGDDDVFCILNKNGKLFTRSGSPADIEHDILRQPLYATDFTRYHFRPKNDERIIFPYMLTHEGYQIIEEATLRTQLPKAYDYLSAHRKKLESRKQSHQWYGYSAPRNLYVHDHADLLIPLLADRGLFAPMATEPERFCVMASAGFSVSLKLTYNKVSTLYVLGLVNSKLLFWNLRLISNKFRGGWITCTKQYFGTLPIRTINFSDPSDKSRHDRMVELVERMLTLHKRLADARIPQDKTMLQQQIDVTDRQIDGLVYELYGLTEEEIKIVEGKL
jgi:type I restriction-modification system DNA methylase subunit